MLLPVPLFSYGLRSSLALILQLSLLFSASGTRPFAPPCKAWREVVLVRQTDFTWLHLSDVFRLHNTSEDIEKCGLHVSVSSK